MSLRDEFERIGENHRRAVIARVARTCFSGSTGRVFPKAKAKGEKSASTRIKETLNNIDIDILPRYLCCDLG